MPNVIDRGRVLAAVRQALESEPRVLALWEGGSAAWQRLDAWSDLDLMILVEDDSVESTWALLEKTLETLGPISLRHGLSPPTWHGHDQVFYRLRDSSEFLMLDVMVLRRSAPERFLERERHGEPLVYFDKTGEIVPAPADREALRKRIQLRLAQLRSIFPLFQPLVKKELLRGNDLDALAFYQGQTLAPLLALLRIRHCPERFDFGLRYADRDLPPEVAAQVRALWFVSSAKEIASKREQAEALFKATLAEIDTSGIGP